MIPIDFCQQKKPGDVSILFKGNNYESTFSPYCKLFKKEIVDSNNLRFNEKIHWGEDRIFVFDYLTRIKNKVAVSSKCDYSYILKEEGSLVTRLNDFSSEYIAYQQCLFKIIELRKYI